MKSREIHTALRYHDAAWAGLQPQCVGGSAAVPKKGEEMLLRAYPGSEVEFWGEERDKVTRKDIAIVV